MPKLVGFAVLPADTFSGSPPSGNAVNNPRNGRETPFDSQPVQGFSGVQFAPGSEDGSTYWFLSDNGFGTQSNTADYRLVVQTQVASTVSGLKREVLYAQSKNYCAIVLSTISRVAA